MSRRLRLAPFLQIAVPALLTAVFSSDANATPYEFLFTPTEAILLATGTTIAPGTKFDLPELKVQFPGYEFESAEEEGQTVWYVFSRRDDEGVGVGGISLYLDFDDPSMIDFIGGGEGVIDAAGATAGVSLIDSYRATDAKCDAGIDYVWESEISPTIAYSVDTEECGAEVNLPSYSTDRELTTLDRA